MTLTEIRSGSKRVYEDNEKLNQSQWAKLIGCAPATVAAAARRGGAHNERQAAPHRFQPERRVFPVEDYPKIVDGFRAARVVGGRYPLHRWAEGVRTYEDFTIYPPSGATLIYEYPTPNMDNTGSTPFTAKYIYKLRKSWERRNLEPTKMMQAVVYKAITADDANAFFGTFGWIENRDDGIYTPDELPKKEGYLDEVYAARSKERICQRLAWESSESEIPADIRERLSALEKKLRATDFRIEDQFRKAFSTWKDTEAWIKTQYAERDELREALEYYRKQE